MSTVASALSRPSIVAHGSEDYRCSCCTRESDRWVGSVLDGRYRIDAKIGSGGFGAVYRAWSLDTDREVAIKMMHQAHAANPTLRARFRREAEVMSSLRNPHAVTTYEVGEDCQRNAFIVMELLRGETLASRIARCGALRWRTALSILRAACHALAEAHAIGVVHRDLKPENIFLLDAPQLDFVKVIDFGIAKVSRDSVELEELTGHGQIFGTTDYMSPEQLAGGVIDGRADIYALGVITYEMITGRRPFEEATTAADLIAAMRTRYPCAPSEYIHGRVPRGLDGVPLRCLEREPLDRYTDVEQVAAAINRVLDGRPECSVGRHSGSEIAYEEEPTWIDLHPSFAIGQSAGVR